MKKGFIFLLLFYFSQAMAQVNTDSLEQILPNLDGEEKVKVLADLCWYLKNSNSDKAYEYGKQALDEATALGDSTLMAQAYNDLSTVMYHRGNFEKSIEYNQIALEIRQKLKDTLGVASNWSKIGNSYYEMGYYEEALSHFLKAEPVFERYNHAAALAMTADNIGSVYRIIGLPKEGLPFHRKAIKANKAAENYYGLANSYGNMALILGYVKSGKDSVLYYYGKAIDLYKQLDDKIGLATAYNNVAIQYKEDGVNDSVLVYYKRAYRLVEEMKDRASMAVYAKNLANSYYALGDTEKAEDYFITSLRYCRETNSLRSLYDGYYHYARFLKDQGNYKKAAFMLDSAMMYKDSVLNDNTSRVVADLEKKYESEKKDAEIAFLNKENALEKEIIERQRAQLIITGVGILLLVALSFAIYRGYKQKKEANEVISEQNEELNMQNEELAAQRDEIERQKASIEAAHTEIKDSIVYAKRIQNAILPPQQRMKQLLSEHFVLYLPKDVVAGDFYWLEKIGNKTLFAAADCTGHGVPGAMVSVVCHNAMNRAVREYKLTDPGKILDKTREIVMEELSKSEENVKDGMDIALCVKEGTTLQFAGAYNPLWLIRKGEIKEVKGDKQPIGKFDHSSPFTTHELTLEPEDVIYVFSDGFVDQFGGDNDKKYGSRRLRQTLLELQPKSMTEQKEALLAAFNEWKDDQPQLDDICLMGVKV